MSTLTTEYSTREEVREMILEILSDDPKEAMDAALVWKRVQELSQGDVRLADYTIVQRELQYEGAVIKVSIGEEDEPKSYTFYKNPSLTGHKGIGSCEDSSTVKTARTPALKPGSPSGPFLARERVA